MSFNTSNIDSDQWFSSRQQNFPFGQLDPIISQRLVSLVSDGVGAFSDFCIKRDARSIKVFDHCCEQLNTLLKNVALESNIGKIVDLDCYMVGLCSYLEMCMKNGQRSQQLTALNNYSKQIDCLKGIKRFCSNYKTYEMFIEV